MTTGLWAKQKPNTCFQFCCSRNLHLTDTDGQQEKKLNLWLFFFFFFFLSTIDGDMFSRCPCGVVVVSTSVLQRTQGRSHKKKKNGFDKKTRTYPGLGMQLKKIRKRNFYSETENETNQRKHEPKRRKVHFPNQRKQRWSAASCWSVLLIARPGNKERRTIQTRPPATTGTISPRPPCLPLCVEFMFRRRGHGESLLRFLSPDQ